VDVAGGVDGAAMVLVGTRAASVVIGGLSSKRTVRRSAERIKVLEEHVEIRALEQRRSLE
jgi:hypothetical protein